MSVLAAPPNGGAAADVPVRMAGNGLGGGGSSPGGFELDQCTGYADTRRPDIHAYAVAHGVQAGGWNGNMWGVLAARAGIPTGSTPAAGAIASFQGGEYGHVAYVEHVNADGSYEVSEENYGYSEWNNGSEEPGYPDNPDPSVRTITATPSGTVFIYGGPVGGGPGGGPAGGGPGGGPAGGGPGGSVGGSNGYEEAFQANTSNLITFGSAGNVNTGQGMRSGTSPSIAASPSGGYQVAFQANTGNLYTFSSSGGPANTSQGMMAGTSPSIAALPGGGYEEAFQANTSNLITFGSAGNVNTGQGMRSGTSPSIAP